MTPSSSIDEASGHRWQPKLVALDLDGTLLKWVADSNSAHEEIPQVVIDAVQSAFNSGAHIVLASGRAPHGMTEVAERLGLRGHGDNLWMVASNGSVIVRYPPLEIVHEETFDAAPAVRMVLALRPSALVAIEERGVGYRVTAPFPEGELDGEMIITNVDALVSEPVSRVIIRDPSATADDFVKMATRLGLHGTDYVVGFTAWIDIAATGVSKGSGLRRVAEALGVDSRDILAIGDGRNDIEMLTWAGRGVAMGQAVPEVISAADDVTGSVDEDGVAHELFRWFGDRSPDRQGVVRPLDVHPS
jgi:Cof subfamily protein (haloacid dehalogenase superfamily)